MTTDAPTRPWYLRRRWALALLLCLGVLALLLWRYGDGDLRALDRRARQAGLPVPGDPTWLKPWDPSTIQALEALDYDARMLRQQMEASLAGVTASGGIAASDLWIHWRRIVEGHLPGNAWQERMALAQHFPAEAIERWWDRVDGLYASSAAAMSDIREFQHTLIGYSTAFVALDTLAFADTATWERRARGNALIAATHPVQIHALREAPTIIQVLRAHLNTARPSPALRRSLEHWVKSWSDLRRIHVQAWKDVRQILGQDAHAVAHHIAMQLSGIEAAPGIGGWLSRWGRQQAAARLSGCIDPTHPQAFVPFIDQMTIDGLIHPVVTDAALASYTNMPRMRLAFDAGMEFLLNERLLPDPHARSGETLRLIPPGSSTGAIWSVGPDGRWDGGTKTDRCLLPAIAP